MDCEWIETYTGRRFCPLDPRPEDVCLTDIVWALSQKCRYTGHCATFFSVAEHSVLVSRLVPAEAKLWGLLHDAAEAYLPDVARPIKRSLAGFEAIEERVLRAIAEALGLPWPVPDVVWEADTIALATEKPVLFPSSPNEWNLGVEAADLPVRCLSPIAARAAFLERFTVLQEMARAQSVL